MADLLPIWVGISMLYLLTGIVIQVAYNGQFPVRVSLSFIGFGSGLFLLVNSRYVLITGVDAFEVLGASMLFVAWVSAVSSVRWLASNRHRWTNAA